MNLTEDTKQLITLIDAGVSPFHCVMEAERFLLVAGFAPLELTGRWKLQPGHGYFLPLFDSTLAAFTVGKNLTGRPSLRLEAAHTDWPCLRLKPSPEVSSERYAKLNVEVYGSPILSTWLDRPLSMAGRVSVAGARPMEPETLFVDFGEPLLTIPNLAIHMNPEANEGMKLNPQVDMLPLLAMLTDDLDKDHFFLNRLASEAGCAPKDILDYEICVYNTDSCTFCGLNGEFLSAPRLDNLTSVLACLHGVTSGMRDNGVNMILLYDNEEIGSRTKQGAFSAVTERILEKLFLALGYDRETYLNTVMDGFLLSMDVAHAIHPNHPEKCDIKNRICMGDGVVLKMSSRQSYATDASCIGAIESICRSAEIPYRKFSNRSDMRGGSTLGAISSAELSLRTVDIGVPILAMHSARELMACADQTAIDRLASEFFLV